MGNCLSSQAADDLSLLNGSADGASPGPGDPPPPPAPPPYQEREAPPALPPRAEEEEEEEAAARLAQRLGLIQHLPRGTFQPGTEPPGKKGRECVICMLEFAGGDALRFLPCLHAYHAACIDAWLLRSFTCPSCMEPVDAALLASYQT